MSVIIILILFLGFYFYNKRRENVSPRIIRQLIRQTSRWATAATQDQNPLIAVLHANYATGYLSALQEITNDSQIVSAMGPSFDLEKFNREILSVQDTATQKMISYCPDYVPQNPYLAKIAREF